jgi:hypothetical protein
MHPNQNLAVLRIFKFQAVFAPFGGEIGQVIHFRRAAIVSVRQARRRFRRQWLLKASKYEAYSSRVSPLSGTPLENAKLVVPVTAKE